MAKITEGYCKGCLHLNLDDMLGCTLKPPPEFVNGICPAWMCPGHIAAELYLHSIGAVLAYPTRSYYTKRYKTRTYILKEETATTTIKHFIEVSVSAHLNEHDMFCGMLDSLSVVERRPYGDIFRDIVEIDRKLKMTKHKPHATQFPEPPKGELKSCSTMGHQCTPCRMPETTAPDSSARIIEECDALKQFLLDPSTISRLADELDAIRVLLLEKNAAYGDSALNPVRVFSKNSPYDALRVRIDDKLSRIARGGSYAGEDTVLDLIGYLVLLRIARKVGSNG